MTAIVAIAAIVFFLNGGSGSTPRSQQGPPDKIAIIAVAPSNPTGDRIDAWVKNVGLGPITSIENAEILVMSPNVTFNVIKHSAAREYSTWLEEPVGSSWDPWDTLHMIVTLPAGSRLAAGQYMFRVSTSRGTIADKIFKVN